MKDAKKLAKYECLGGPLCGEKVRRLRPTRIGIPAIMWKDEDNQPHMYRLARSGGKTYWHYLGPTACLEVTRKITMRLLPPID